MSRFITPDKVFDYFDNVVSPTRTNMLHLKQTSVYFEEQCQNFTCYCSKRRINRFLGHVLLARGYRNIHYLCNICIHLVILCWKWFKKKMLVQQSDAKSIIEKKSNEQVPPPPPLQSPSPQPPTPLTPPSGTPPAIFPKKKSMNLPID